MAWTGLDHSHVTLRVTEFVALFPPLCCTVHVIGCWWSEAMGLKVKLEVSFCCPPVNGSDWTLMLPSRFQVMLGG